MMGVGQATLANVWAGTEIGDMKKFAKKILQNLVNAKNPIGVYQAMMPNLLADSSLGNVGKLVCYAGFDLALWDAWGKRHGQHPCQMLGDIDEKYTDLFLPQPRQQLYVEFTLGGVSPLLGDNGLLAQKLRHGYRVVKVKCVGDPEKDFNRIMAVRATTNCRIWLDFNGAGNPEGVRQLCEALRASLRQGELLAVEQPFSTTETGSIDVHGMSHVPFFLDESAVLPTDVINAKNLGYTGVVVKADKGGLSYVAEMVLTARECEMLVSVQDLTSHPWASLGIATHLANLHGEIVEMNQGQFLVAPVPVDIRNGAVDTSGLTGPGFYP
jgi:L-alanine-DL-glutamate epimerase-like enolase superfamily enzyme